MYSTQNDLAETTRTKVIELLDARLADATDLQTQLKQVHWNVKGPTFIALYELVDKINEAVEDYMGDLAERVVQLGGIAHGTARQVARRISRRTDNPTARGRAAEQPGAIRIHALAAGWQPGRAWRKA